jgi:hypothetical protein
MQHIDGTREFSDVHYSERSSIVPNPNLLHTWAYRAHWLPIVRFAAALNLIGLIACFAPSREGEGAQIIKGAASEFNGFGAAHGVII